MLHVGGVVQSLSHVWLSVTHMDCSTPGFPVHHHSRSLLKLMSIESVMPSNHLILCHPLLLLPSIFPNIRVFSNESALRIRCQSIETSASASALVLLMNIQDWFPLGLTDSMSLQSKEFKILDSLLRHHSSKASVFWCSAFFMVQLSHPYTTTGKTIALNIWTFVSKVISLLFNMLPRLVINFLRSSKCLLIPWL